MPHDFNAFPSELLSPLHYVQLLLLIGAYNASWGKGPYPVFPRGWSAWVYRILWSLSINGLAAGVISWYLACVHVDVNGATPHFKISHQSLYDWTWILIIVHFVHVKLLEFYNRARFLRFEYYVSTVLFVLTLLSGGVIAGFLFYQKVWGGAVAFTVYTAILLYILIISVVRIDKVAEKMSMKMMTLRASQRKVSGQKKPKNT